MVTIVLQSKTSVKFALDYSEKKVEAGVASVEAVRNLPSEDFFAIYDTFEKYENNPAISERTRRFCFHMAVNPSETDEINGDRERVLEYIDFMMDKLGYGQQPYVVYRHNDIAREHYHVVSTRILPDGRPVGRDKGYAATFEGKFVLKTMKEVAKKFGFTVGRKEEQEMMEAIEGRVLPTDSDKIRKIRRNYEEAMKYDFTSFAQFRTVLSTMGVYVKNRVVEGRMRLWLAVEDEDGKVASSGMDADYMFRSKTDGMSAWERYQEREKKNTERKMDARVKAKMQAAVEFGATRARTRAEFAKILSEVGLEFAPEMKGGHLKSYTLVDPKYRCVTPGLSLGKAYAAAVLDEKGWPEGEKVYERILRDDDVEVIRRRMLELTGGRYRTGRKAGEEKAKEKQMQKPAVKQTVEVPSGQGVSKMK